MIAIVISKNMSIYKSNIWELLFGIGKNEYKQKVYIC